MTQNKTPETNSLIFFFKGEGGGTMERGASTFLTALNQGVGVVVWGEGGGQLQRLHAAPHTKVDIERTAGEEIYGR